MPNPLEIDGIEKYSELQKEKPAKKLVQERSSERTFTTEERAAANRIGTPQHRNLRR